MNRVRAASQARTGGTDTERLRNAILEAFLSSPDRTLSGQQLSARIGVTRTAIWKHIQYLQGLGFMFTAAPGSGYTLTAVPDLLLEPLLRRKLPPGTTIGQTVHWYETVDSTNRLAAELATDPATPHGTLVTAREQTGGRGRRGRAWFAPPEGLWLSMILKHSFPLARAAELTLLASVAVRRAIWNTAQVRADIKWPNDLYVNGRKVCGILAEIRAEGEQVHQAVLGIGINTNIPPRAFPEALRATATSLLAESARSVSHLDITASLWGEFEPLYDSLVADAAGFAAVSDEWRQASMTLGRHIVVKTGGTTLEGKAVELLNDGTLLLQTADGRELPVRSGEVLFSST